jgi:MoaA/NifB/PqqE/SkfB family radical SAM enzyme
MFKFSDLKSIHIELTSNCQAKCPMCARNNHGGLPNPLLKIKEWTFDSFKNIINQEVLETVDKIYFCGNFGDPIMHDDLISICEYINKNNSSIFIGIHTNGSARNCEWWTSLALALPINHCVHFGIDGLEDTHHLYRTGTNFNHIIRNASSFIEAGGRAEWTFIKFKHNEHQVDECKERAKQLGFEKFMLKNSSRFIGGPTYDVLDKNGDVTYIIEPPSDNVVKFLPKSIIESYKKVVEEAQIECVVQKIKEIYIDAYLTILPCCWLNSIPYKYYDPTKINENVGNDIKSQYEKLINDFGGIDKLNASNGIENIINSETWQSIWYNKWGTDKLITCAKVCGKFNDTRISKPSEQFIESSKL